MTVMGFDSFEEMQEFLRKQSEAANAGLHPSQRALTYGDHWVRFVNVADREVEFGYVYTLDEVREHEAMGGATQSEVDTVVELTERQQADNLLYGRAYIAWQPEGESGYAHRAAVWPIDQRLFNAASEADWNIDGLDATGRALLEIAYATARAHDISKARS